MNVSEDTMIVLRAMALGVGITTVPSHVYEELQRHDLARGSKPCLPYFSLTPKGAALVQDVKRPPEVSGWEWWQRDEPLPVAS